MSMNNYFGGDVFVTLELPNGQVHKFKALTASMTIISEMIDCASYDNPFLRLPGAQRMKFDFEATSEIITTQSDIKQRVLEFKKSKEWKCEYCTTPNNKENKTCCKCGAPRSFIYED